MKKPLVVFFLFLIIFSIVLVIGSNSRAIETLQAGDKSQEYVPHELLVKLKEDSVGDRVQSKWLIRNVVNLVQGKIKTYLNQEKETFDWDPSVFKHRSFIGDPYLFHIRIPEGIDLDYAISYLKSNPYVEYVEKNGIGHISTNDEYFNQQWGLYNPNLRADIHAQEAWAISTGSSEVIVAVLDTGIDYNHEDLQGNLWTNPNEFPEPDGIDNDNNGFNDDIRGWNFIAPAGSPLQKDPMDDHRCEDAETAEGEAYCKPKDVFHGTHCAGIIGAVGNNGIGISGVNWNVKIMPLKVANSCGKVETALATNATDYATINGAFLSSNSYGSHNYLSFKAAITRALNKNRLFVTSAGNSDIADNIDVDPYYPACFDNANIISVLATTASDTKRTTSNYGMFSVDIGAPGEEILSTQGYYDHYQELSGTSMAAPHVAGVAALALGICPGLTYDRLKDLIIDGADFRFALAGMCVANGRLNAFNVLNAIGGTTPPSAPSNLAAYPIAWNYIKVYWHDNSNNEVGFEIQRKDQFQQAAFLHENCVDSNSTPIASFQDNIDPTEQRTYTYRVRAANRAGISSFTNEVGVSIPLTVPNAPTNLDGQSPTLEQDVNIYWSNHAVNALYTKVERRISGYPGWEVVATLSYSADTYEDRNAQSGNTYEYRIRAWNPLGYSDYSNIIAIEVIDW